MLSIVIPTYNEHENIATLVAYLIKHGNHATEIIVSDAGSNDHTIEKAVQAGAKAVLSPAKGRAAQMNYGASIATGNILYFVHADTFPPPSFTSDIETSIKKGFGLGRYCTKFNSKKFILKINAFFTRFDLFMCYGGDQTLFITKDLFESIGGFNADMRIMEDYEIVERAKKGSSYKIIQKSALISARKYEINKWFRVQKANYTIVQMYKHGASQEDMVKKYAALLNYR